jgi:hypothetical protein
MAREVIWRIRQLTSKPIRYVVLTHYHAVRVLGASAYRAEHIIASDATLELIRERGTQDMKSEMARFPRLFHGAHTGQAHVAPRQARSAHQPAWAGTHRGRHDRLGAFAGDAHLKEWRATLDRLRALRPRAWSRGPALSTLLLANARLPTPRNSSAACTAVRVRARRRMDPAYGRYPIYEHCMPFDVSRAFDEARGITHPRIWTARRDREMWKAIA